MRAPIVPHFALFHLILMRTMVFYSFLFPRKLILWNSEITALDPSLRVSVLGTNIPQKLRRNRDCLKEQSQRKHCSLKSMFPESVANIKRFLIPNVIFKSSMICFQSDVAGTASRGQHRRIRVRRGCNLRATIPQCSKPLHKIDQGKGKSRIL